MKIEITKAQLQAIISMKDDMETMLGNGKFDVDKIWEGYIRLVKRMLKKNKIKEK